MSTAGETGDTAHRRVIQHVFMECLRATGGLDRDTITVECLACSASRLVRRGSNGAVIAGFCPRCGDVGWAQPADLSEGDRRLLHAVRSAAAPPFAA